MLNSYSRWLNRQLVQPKRSISLRHGAGTNLILGVARNYGAADLRPFIRSARKHHDCRMLLLIDRNPDLAIALEAEGVDCVMDDKTVESGQPHMNFARSSDYIQMLQALAGQVQRVFLADTRDVIFQADIFASQPDAPITFFEEARGFSFETASWNGNALRKTFGPGVYDQIKQSEVICSGTVLARYEEAITYCWLKLLLSQLVIYRRRHMRPGVDQMTTNVVARLNLMPGSVVEPYNGAIVTLSGGNKDFLRLSACNQLLVCPAGKVPAVVHQYDRVPEFRDRIYATYDGPKRGNAGGDTKKHTVVKRLRELFGPV